MSASCACGCVCLMAAAMARVRCCFLSMVSRAVGPAPWKCEWRVSTCDRNTTCMSHMGGCSAVHVARGSDWGCHTAVWVQIGQPEQAGLGRCPCHCSTHPQIHSLTHTLTHHIGGTVLAQHSVQDLRALQHAGQHCWGRPAGHLQVACVCDHLKVEHHVVPYWPLLAQVCPDATHSQALLTTVDIHDMGGLQREAGSSGGCAYPSDVQSHEAQAKCHPPAGAAVAVALLLLRLGVACHPHHPSGQSQRRLPCSSKHLVHLQQRQRHTPTGGTAMPCARPPPHRAAPHSIAWGLISRQSALQLASFMLDPRSSFDGECSTAPLKLCKRGGRIRTLLGAYLVQKAQWFVSQSIDAAMCNVRILARGEKPRTALPPAADVSRERESCGLKSLFAMSVLLAVFVCVWRLVLARFL